MRLRRECGIWEIFIPGVAGGVPYKYELRSPAGQVLPLKADPYALQAELRPATESIVAALPPLVPPSADRQRANALDAPISIYEVHLGSWRRKPEQGNRWLSWDELADELVPYASAQGFTHLELLPISEHPFDGSWGYQPIGLYAPTARFGEPAGFRRFVQRCHASGLGLLIVWVPAHFPSDDHGPGQFDGTALYEHADPREGFHHDWNTLIYNFGRTEVRNFLVGNALYWLERYGVDGLRVDAVASMLYRDYSRKADEWVPNVHGGRENLEAIAFLKRLNEEVYREYPDVQTFAEESTSWPLVSRPLYVGGLGFGFKWDMGWMHDTLHYMHHDPIHRKYHHNELTFRTMYASSENFVLPLSHDEVVHMKGSLLDKMPGQDHTRFANLRLLFAWQHAQPGKKLLFMGGEIGQWREWNHNNSLDWDLLEYDRHRGMLRWVEDINRIYRNDPAMQVDTNPDGFEWIDGGDADHSVIAFLRKGAQPGGEILIVCNFTPVPRFHYRVGVPTGGYWKELLNSDAKEYWGSGMGNAGGMQADATPSHPRSYSLNLLLPPLAVCFFKQGE